MSGATCLNTVCHSVRYFSLYISFVFFVCLVVISRVSATSRFPLPASRLAFISRVAELYPQLF